MKKVDVIVVGAGAAGLAAASKLIEAGKKTAILEARPRVGGRVFTVHPEKCGHAVELGAEFIHGMPEQILSRLSKLDHPLVYTVADHHHRLKKRGLAELEDAWKEILKPMRGLGRLKKDRSFAEYLKSSSASPLQKQMAKMFIEGFNAAEISKTSALSLSSLAEEMEGDGSKMARFLSGYSQLFDAFLSSSLKRKLSLDTVVKKVQWEQGRVEMTAIKENKTQKFEASKALFTLPIGVLKAKPPEQGAVVFDPPLKKKAEALEKMEMGAVVKVVLLFNFQFWEKIMKKKEVSFIHCGPHEPFQVLWSSSPLQIPMWTAWAGGSAALRLASYSEKELVEKAFHILARAFNVKKSFLWEHLERHFFHPWITDPFSRGAYSYVGVNGLRAQKVLRQPEKNTLFFAGEALNEQGQTGTVDAAIATGERAAELILKASSHSKKTRRI